LTEDATVPPQKTPAKKRTFTNEMRRATILEHAVETIASATRTPRSHGSPSAPD
jgi:hypothetical protein